MKTSWVLRIAQWDKISDEYNVPTIYAILPDKALFSINQKVLIFFIFLHENIHVSCGYYFGSHSVCFSWVPITSFRREIRKIFTWRPSYLEQWYAFMKKLAKWLSESPFIIVYEVRRYLLLLIFMITLYQSSHAWSGWRWENVMTIYTLSIWTGLSRQCRYRSGPSCSKLTTSLVNDSLKFTSNDMQIFWYFLLKKCE